MHKVIYACILSHACWKSLERAWIKLFSVTFVTIGFTLIAITIIILTINSSKVPMILCIVFSVAAKFSHLILLKAGCQIWCKSTNQIRVTICVSYHDENLSRLMFTFAYNFCLTDVLKYEILKNIPTSVWYSPWFILDM